MPSQRRSLVNDVSTFRRGHARCGLLWGFACAWLLGAGVSPAASAGELVVKGTAEESLTPQLIRVRCEMIGRGDSLQAAFGQLQINRAKAVAKIKKLGAVEKSVRIGTARMATHLFGMDELVPTPELAGLQPVPVSLNLSEPASDRSKSPVVMSELIAEIPLVGSDELERMIAVETLAAEIKDADLGGLKTLPEGFVCKSCGGQVGQADIMFVAKLSGEDQQRFIAEALGRARSHAVKIAAATGSKLGLLKSISFTGDQAGATTLNPLDGPLSLSISSPRGFGGAGEPAEIPSESTGSDANVVRHRFHVTVSFELSRE